MINFQGEYQKMADNVSCKKKMYFKPCLEKFVRVVCIVFYFVCTQTDC